MDNTAGHIASAFEYGHDVHASALENFFQIQCHAKKIFSVFRQGTSFDIV